MRGDLFEVVPGQLFAGALRRPPEHRVSSGCASANPAPYGALINLGGGEFLVSASPEMYVRVEGRRIETCPISGTIRRGRDAIEDADRILELLNSEEGRERIDDVHRCRPQRQIAGLRRRQRQGHRPPADRDVFAADPHGRPCRGRCCAPEFDALDGFLSHAWAVTVTGAPKLWAIRFIEEHERSARRWYGGAIGRADLRRQHEHRPDIAHDAHAGRHRRGPRRRDAAVSTATRKPRRRKRRLKASALFAAISGQAGGAARGGARRRLGARPQGAADRPRKFVRPHAGRVYPRHRRRRRDAAPRFRARRTARRAPRPTSSCCRPGPAGPTISRCARRSTCCWRGTSRSSASASACRALSNISAARSACSTCRCTASRRWCAPCRAACFRVCPSEFTVGRYHSLYALRDRLAGGACRSRPRPRRTASSWRSSTTPCRSRQCSSTPNW